MIVMGTHGYGALGRAVMGSVAQNVISGSKVPVLLVR
jgi:nucleotide-binding universal stress UspA family protein